MSYGMHLVNKKTNEIVQLKNYKVEEGCTYCIGGTSFCELSITYNYYDWFKKVFGEKSVRSLYGKTAFECIPILSKAIYDLKDEKVDPDYYKDAGGNARNSLIGLLMITLEAVREYPSEEMIWSGD